MFSSVSGGVRQQIWSGMEQLFAKYAEGAKSITPKQIEKVLKEVMGREDPSEIDYVLNNLFRLDTDGSGDVDFPQFATYILQHYCGQLSLQDMHKQGQISRSQNHLISLPQFLTLLNRAYKFLNITVDEPTATHIFKLADKDGDGFITYPEYFGFIRNYLCEAKVKQQVKQQASKRQIRRYSSRLRDFFWRHLRALFAKYDGNSDGVLETVEVENLAREVLGCRKKGEFEYVVHTVFQMRSSQKIAFEDFVERFLGYVIELNLSKLAQSNTNKKLALQEFILLIKTAFVFLPWSNPDSVLTKFYQLLDHEKNGLVGFEQASHWVKDFIAVGKLQTDEYYLLEDDISNTAGQSFISQTGPAVSTSIPSSSTLSPTPTRTQPLRPLQPLQFSSPTRTSQPKIQSTSIIAQPVTKRFTVQQTLKQVKTKKQQPTVTVSVKCPFKFTSQTLANSVRKQILHILSQFDANNNKQFQQSQIIDILQSLMKQDKNEVRYVIANVFRYDKNNDKIVSYDQLANFFLEVHCGEIAIQRLHKRNSYKLGAQRVMSLSEFITTLNYALSFISIVPTEEQLTWLFNDIDRNRDGVISYQEYFEFLRYYFGSQSEAAQTGGEEVVQVRRKVREEGGVAEERFSKLIRAQARVLFMGFDVNRNVMFERSEASQLLNNLLKHTTQQQTFVLDQLYRSNTQSLDYDTFNGHLLQLHFSDIFLKRWTPKLLKGQSQLLSKSQFISLIQDSCHFIPVKSETEQLEIIFENIDTNSDGMVSFYEFGEFVKKWLGSTRQVHPPVTNFKPYWATGLTGLVGK